MSNFRLGKEFDSIICLSSSLLALPNFKLIEKSLKKMYKHLNQGGILFLDMSNHAKEIKECNNIEEKESKKFLGGVLNSTFLSYKKGKKWREEWYGEVKKGKKIFKFKDLWEELIYSHERLELVLNKIGFETIEKYSSMKGDKFYKRNSWRRIYVCQKVKK